MARNSPAFPPAGVPDVSWRGADLRNPRQRPNRSYNTAFSTAQVDLGLMMSASLPSWFRHRLIFYGQFVRIQFVSTSPDGNPIRFVLGPDSKFICGPGQDASVTTMLNPTKDGCSTPHPVLRRLNEAYIGGKQVFSRSSSVSFILGT